MIDTEQRPVLSGFVALAVVALAAGLLGGLAMAFGANVFGIGGGGSDGGEPSAKETLFLPEPKPTEDAATTETEEPAPDSSDEGEGTKEEEKKDKGIVLTAAQSSVAPMAQIDLTGTYAAPDGAFLQVQRFDGGSWTDFPVTMRLEGQRFATFVQTGRSGPNKFRVVDTDSGKHSNPVEVTVG